MLPCTFIVIFYAVKCVESDCAVSHCQTDETTFEFLELGLVGFSLLLRSLAVDLFHIFIVGVFEAFVCNQRGGIEVSPIR